jgi:hypothetical protein
MRTAETILHVIRDPNPKVHHWRAGCLKTGTSGSEGVATRCRVRICYGGTQAAHNPVFYHWYATRTCGESNPAVRSSWDNVILIHPDGSETARRQDDCQRQGGRELASDGMVNRCEPLYTS